MISFVLCMNDDLFEVRNSMVCDILIGCVGCLSSVGLSSVGWMIGLFSMVLVIWVLIMLGCIELMWILNGVRFMV